VEASFSDLALYAACPLKYRYLRVERLEEPQVAPDWRHAPAEQRLGVASDFDRQLGLAVHVALMRWQRAVDGGAPARGEDLVARVEEEARGRGLDAATLARQMKTLAPRLAAYATGPWPRRTTLFLEQSVRHRLEAPDGFAVDLHLRVDRVVRYQRQVAILDFKSVPPHAFQLRADAWQLRTYAMAAPELLGVAPRLVRLFLVDLRRGREVEVTATETELSAARDELLACARGIAATEFGVEGHDDRPCWSCGFRQVCPNSLAPG
jgi:hypothetical protein